MRGLLAALVPDDGPLELQLVGRTLLHAALVGLLAGLVGSAFLFGLEHVQQLVLENLAGYEPLLAAGEKHGAGPAAPFRWYVLFLVPALGGLGCGLVARFAPEVRGGGGDAAIKAFHQHGGQVRRRVLWAKPLASISTLATGGAGGREGPTMQIGAAIGALVARYIAPSPRERRILMVAGVAAGISAVFRTPLGAALLAIEVLYRDDFESDALIPAVLASVVAYSIALSVFGSSPLFGALPHFAFHAYQLPLFLGLALVVSLGAALFAATMRAAHSLFDRLPVPLWLRPALGGLMLGVFAVVLLTTLAPSLGNGHRGLGVLGGGYGAGQLAIGGATWLTPDWSMVQLLVLLALAKIVATSLTIGSGGAAGDFAPSLAVGGLLGGAFGLAAQLVFADPAIQPGAFALVGMAAFYAGIANVPLAALVLVCEVAGSYDLLVPLMLTEAVAMIALRKVNLYRSQPRTTRDSPVYASPLRRMCCADLVDPARVVVTIGLATSMRDVVAVVEQTPEQDVFPVLDQAGKIVGLVVADALRTFAAAPEAMGLAIAADVMKPAVTFEQTTPLRDAVVQLLRSDVRAAPVVDGAGRIVGLLDEADIMRMLSGNEQESRASTHG